MDDQTEDQVQYQAMEPDAVNRRFWRHIFVVVCAGTLVAAAYGSPSFAGGVFLGGLLAAFNYRWLLSSVRGILAIGGSRVPPGTTMMFMFRWLVVAALGYGAYYLFHFSSTGIVTGLLAPAAAALMEAGYLSFKLIATQSKSEPLKID